MHRRITILFVTLAAAVLIGCNSRPQISVEDAFTEFRSAIRDVETPEEKTALCEDFLTQFPESEHTADLSGAVAYYRGEQMEDPAGAVAFLDGLLAKVEDPEQRFGIYMAQFPLAREIGQAKDLEAIIAELETHRDLTFTEHIDVGEMAAGYKLWSLAEAQADAASRLATAEAFRAEYPETDLTDDELAGKANNRSVMAATHRGWALAHLDREPEALEVFEAAAPLSQSNYLGVPSTELFSFWGRTALAQGNAEKALELLGPTAVLGDNDDAFAAYRQAYIAIHEDEAGFEDFLWSARQNLAKVVDDFELPDYEGTLKRLSDTKGNVVFLAFWFPT